LKKGNPRSVTTITPLRISFVGGGTDLPGYYNQHEGAVISSAIDQYVYVTVKQHSPLFGEKYRLSYYKTEHSNSLNAIENGIARECLRLVGVEPPLYISTVADLPASSGLGSSSSFTVGLLNALHHMKGERVSAGQLAEEACEVEINMLGSPIGKQDQYAAAFGGLNHICFKKNGRVTIDHLVTQGSLIERIFENSLLLWTGIKRDANTILSKQCEEIESKLDHYLNLDNMVSEYKGHLLNPSDDVLNQIGALLDRSWKVKRKLSDKISTDVVDSLYHELTEMGFYGGKLSGAGGGGFIYGIATKDIQKLIGQKFGSHNLVNVKYEPLGSRLMFVI
jgi:D-glycero-alpha-D-manno-heptose-7-phosphate kinase